MAMLYKISVAAFIIFSFAGKGKSHEYSVNDIPVMQKLSGSYIYTFAQDSGGYFWIGTSDGLFRFDGQGLQQYTVADSLADNFITCSRAVKNGIWFGHINGGLTFFDGKKFKKVIPATNNKGSITSIAVSGDGTVWAGDYNGALFKPGAKNPESFRFSQPGISINSFSFVSDSIFLCGSLDGLRLCKISSHNTIEVLEHFESVPRERIQSVIGHKNPHIHYVATANSGIFMVQTEKKQAKVSRIDSKSGPLPGDIQCIAEDRRGNLWAATFGKGLFKLILSESGQVDEVVSFEHNKEQLPENIKFVFCDRDENIWAGAYGQGVFCLAAQTFSVRLAHNSAYGQNVKCIAADSLYLWAGTEKGLLKMSAKDHAVLGFFASGQKLPEAEISALWLKNKYELWVGTNGSGIYKINLIDNSVQNFSIHDGMLENMVTCLAGSDSILWVGTKKGACRVNTRNKQKKWYTIHEGGLPHNSVRHIYIDSGKKVWIATPSNSIAVVAAGRVKKTTISSGASIVTIESVAEDISGNIWLASGGQGLFLLQNDSVLNLSAKEGLYSDYCYSLASDKQGYIWVGHRGGLSRVNSTGFSIKAVSKYAGLDDEAEFNPNAILCDNSGKMWFGFNKGLLAYDPALENVLFLPPLVHLTSVNVNNQEFELQEKIKLYPGRYKIRFGFIGISLKDPGSVRYQYRLKGYDIDWSDISATNSVTYPALTEGKYVFEVNASSSDGIVTPKPARVEIIVKAPVWKSPWLYIIAFAVLALAILFYNKKLQQKHILEKHILEEKVQERTLEIQRQKDEIEMQRDLIKKKNTDITDSLKYARKIQSSIIPPDELLEKLLPDHFLVNKPKDIVSGDFCWYTQLNEKTIVTVADCTGHGVPGAMMSILGLNALNEIVINYGITEPSRVLEFLRLKVITSLSQHSKDSPSFDGINLGLCVIDQQTLMVQFSGAINNMVHIQDGKLNVIKADRIPIGVSDLEHKSFSDIGFQGKKGDVLYLFTDGFQDQFGGKNDKKFSSKRFLNTLFGLHKEPLLKQKAELEKILSEWMGGNEQTDDITILGFRL
ncbi:MAG: SpoIIE family protein phosphatase [Bacteroidales bacterium]|nr:SpoIIE family protein phosphatase [Bacteroidales bacterium]